MEQLNYKKASKKYLFTNQKMMNQKPPGGKQLYLTQTKKKQGNQKSKKLQ